MVCEDPVADSIDERRQRLGDLDQDLDDLLRRMGGDPTWKQQQAWLSNPLVQRLAAALDVDLGPVLEARRQFLDSSIALLRATVRLAEFGWVVSAHRLRGEVYAEAVDLIESGADAEAVDALMTGAWGETDGVALRGSYGWLHHLYGPDDASIDLMIGRVTLLDQALEHHRHGEYAAATLIALSQIDGIVYDALGAHGFFSRDTGDFLEDDATVAGLPGNLKVVWRGVVQQSHQTMLGGRFQRHPIIHGRELGFGTEVNSTKAFALLGSVIEWLHGRTAESRGQRGSA